VRTVAIPAAIRAELVAHLAEFVDAGEGGHVDQGHDGANGHDDMRAALIYQRATSDADRPGVPAAAVPRSARRTDAPRPVSCSPVLGEPCSRGCVQAWRGRSAARQGRTAEGVSCMGENIETDRPARVPVDVGRPGITFRRGEQAVGAAPASRRCRSVINGRVRARLLQSWTERAPLSRAGTRK